MFFVRFVFQLFHFIAEPLQFALAFLDALVQVTALLLQRLNMVTDQKAGDQAERRAGSTSGQTIAPYTADPAPTPDPTTVPTPAAFSLVVSGCKSPPTCEQPNVASKTTPSVIRSEYFIDDQYPIKIKANAMPQMACVIVGKNDSAVAKPANSSAMQLKYEKRDYAGTQGFTQCLTGR